MAISTEAIDRFHQELFTAGKETGLPNQVNVNSKCSVTLLINATQQLAQAIPVCNEIKILVWEVVV